jgi:hypothetical protein
MANSFDIELSAAQLAALSVRAKSIGLDPNATSGTLPESHGVALSYHIAPADKGNHIVSASNGAVIHFDVVHKPALVSVSMIKSHVKGLLGI